LQGHDSTLRDPCHPGIQLRPLPLAHESGKVLREFDGFRDLCMLRMELHEYGLVVWRSPLRAPEDQPGCLAGCEERLSGLDHDWEGLPQGEFLGIPATNRVVRVWGMVIDRFEGGKVKSTRILLDTLSLMQQLGVVPIAPESSSNPNAALS
jgi:hypothetical protein